MPGDCESRIRADRLDQLTFVENGLSPAAETPFSKKPMPRRIRRH
jgi:hypothetical protein